MRTDAAAIEALVDWLCAGAPPPAGMRRSLRTGLETLHAAGVPVDRFALFVLTIHPLIGGRRLTWSPGEDVFVSEASHDLFRQPIYLDSPIRTVFETGEPVRRRFLESPAPDAYPTLAEFRDEGYTDYLALPLPLAGGGRYAVTWLTRHPRGFSAEAVAALKRINDPVARLVETYSLRFNTVAILSTYVGRNAGAQVLDGHIRRGDAEAIHAAVLFADLKGFTALSNRVAPRELIDLLNRFFDALEPAIEAEGGEILKFMGDGMLAIFPAARDPAAKRRAVDAALAALDAARATLAEADDFPGFRAAIHLGDVHYGNIGAQNRLDFTVIGPTVNLAARMLAAAERVGSDTVCSADAAAVAPERCGARTETALRGFDAPQTVAVVRDPAPGAPRPIAGPGSRR